MKTLTAIIVDDERHARESLSTILELYCPKVKLLRTCSNLKEAKEAIGKDNPDLVFLDIAIGEENGFDLLESLITIPFQLIFTTAFSEFALKAFRVNAIDYLLKPIDPKQLKNAVDRALERDGKNQMQEQFSHLLESMQNKKVEKLAISSIEGIVFVGLDQILHITGSGNYSTFHLENNDKMTASKSLKYFMELLPLNTYFRCHQSHVININHVYKIKSGEGIIELVNGTEVPLAKSKKELLMAVMGKRN